MKNIIPRKFAKLGICYLIFSSCHVAAQELPGSVEPGRISGQVAALEPLPQAQQPVTPKPEEAKGTLGKAAEKIKFTLKKITIEGNSVYTTEQLAQLYQNKLNTEITVAELQNIVLSISNYYRNNGYIITRAILPPQKIKNGEVKIRILEGYINQVNIIGTPRGARCLVWAMGQNIAYCRPLHMDRLEYYLRVANEIPGVSVKSVLEPSKNATGASDLNLAVDTKPYAAVISYDNYGTRYIGPQQLTTALAVNSVFLPGDSTSLTYVTVPKPKQLKFFDLSYDMPVCTHGARFRIGGNKAVTRPGFVLKELKIEGQAETFYGVLSVPIIRTRSQNLTFETGYNYLDSQVTSFDIPLYTDHIRSVRVGGTYDFSDRFKGANLIALHLHQGLPILGATHNTKSFTTSRFGGRGNFTKIVLQASRIQTLRGRFTAFALFRGQYAFNPLLASEQFGFGGPQLGRGYDPSEIIGDRGVGGTIELRMNFTPKKIIDNLQAYWFYDAGIIWNIKNVPNIERKQSATSTGVGLRFYFIKYISGNIMIAQPLTRQVAALQLIGRGRRPRVFFSISGSF